MWDRYHVIGRHNGVLRLSHPICTPSGFILSAAVWRRGELFVRVVLFALLYMPWLIAGIPIY